MRMALDVAVSGDPAALMRAQGFAPDPWQEELLRSGGPRMLLLCTRQAGKSTVAALLALHEALYRPGSLVLMLAPSLRQSQELFRKLIGYYNASGRPVPAQGETSLRLELENGSRIISLPGKEETVRGFSEVRLLVVDEAARVPDELYYAIRPMLAVSGGRLIALSTPWGKRGWFHQEWTHGAAAAGAEQGWNKVCIPADQCPRISPQFLAEERKALGNWWFQQEYECKFSDTNDQVFSSEHIDRLLDDNVKPLFEDW